MTASVQPSAGSGNLTPVVAELFEELANRVQAGEPIDIEAVNAAHPEHAEALRRLLPAVQVLADLGRSASAAGSAPPQVSSDGEPVSGVLGDFRIIRQVGRGGMGVVYEAEQVSLGRRVALKVLPFAATMDPRHLQRFHNEARAAAGLHHTNIVPVHAVGCERGVHYYAMQFIDGQTLADFIAQQRQGVVSQVPTMAEAGAVAGAGTTVPPAAQATSAAPRDAAYFRQAAEWGIQAAEALDHAHQMGIVHRDVKPANLLVDLTGRLWVTDFGLAQVQSDVRVTMTGDLVGTLRYMSPEQALAKRVVIDHRTDVYSLGVTLYELLTLEPAFRGSDRQELLRQIAFEEPKPPRRLNKAIPVELETIVLKAMEKHPADRYATAQELGSDLRHFLEARPIQARRPSLFHRARKWAQRHKVWVGAAFLVLVVMTVAAAVSSVLVWRAFEAEAAQRRLADANHQAAREQRRQARQAVDRMYLQVADKWLDRQPEMDKLQREFLEEVLRYYRAFAEEGGDDPEALYDRAKASRIVAMILLRTGLGPDYPRAARQALLEATAILEKLLQNSPDEPNYTEELALTQMRLAMTGPPPGEAPKYFRRSLALLDNLVRRFPERPQHRFQLARCLVNSWYARSMSTGPEAETPCRRAVALLEELSRVPAPDPQHLLLLAMAYRNLGDALRLLGRTPEAVENCQKAIDAIGKIGPDAVGLPEYQHVLGPFDWHNVGNTYRTLAQSLGQAGRLEDAESAFARAIRIHEKLVADFPRTHHYWIALFHDYRDQATLCWTSGRKDQADRAYQRTQDLGERMVAAFPPPHNASNEVARFLVACPDPKYRRVRRGVEVATIGTTVPGAADAEDVWKTLAVGQYRTGDYPAALAALEHLIELRPEEHGADWFLMALVQWRLGDRDRALACNRKAVEWMAKNMPGDDELRLLQAEAAELLGIKDRPATAKEGVPPKE